MRCTGALLLAIVACGGASGGHAPADAVPGPAPSGVPPSPAPQASPTSTPPPIAPTPTPAATATPTSSPTATPTPPPTPTPTATAAAAVKLADRASGAIALNTSDVFFATWDQHLFPDSTEVFHTIRAVSKNGGAPRFVASSPDDVVDIVANGAWVYWTTLDGSPRTGVYRAPVSGGETELVVAGVHFSDLALDDGAAYVAQAPAVGQGTGTVLAIPHAGHAPIVLQDGVSLWGWRSGLAADASHVYFVDDPPPANLDGTSDAAFIKRVPKSGGPVTTVVACVDAWPCGWFALRVDDTTLYWRDRAGEVQARSKDGVATVTISPSAVGEAFDVSGSTACWVVPWSGPRSDPNPFPVPGVRCANVDGTGVHAIDTEVVYGWFGPRVDGRYVYYVKAGALLRRER